MEGLPNNLVQEGVDLSSLNTWHIGGKAQYFAQPETYEQCAQLLRQKPESLPVTWLGLGSNVLIPDGGLQGLVIHTKKLNSIEFKDGLVYAQAGVPCAKLAKIACKNDGIDGEFFAGIPGTVGGALAMNAGAFGASTWERVFEVHTLDSNGEQHTRKCSDFDIGYRHMRSKSFKDEVFLAGIFNFSIEQGQGLLAFDRVKELLKKRNHSQPIGTFNCGSVFKNPKDGFAAALIEACGLKGFMHGGAMISKKHANFIINQQNASSDDVIRLIQIMQTQVKDKFGIELEPEVRIIGQKRSHG